MKTIGEIPCITAAGTPYQIGYAHGSGAKERIAVSLATYREMFWDYSGISWEQTQKIAESFVPCIENYNPDYLAEMQGIADGAGVQFWEILALNVRSELVLQGGSLVSDGCTSVAVTPERTAGGVTLIGQNWDWKMSIRQALILLRIHQENGKPDICMMTEAGIIGKIGCNSAGLGVCLNALSVDAAPSGVPLHIALRGILDSQNLNDAVRAAVREKLGCCANFLIAHRDGEALDVEVANDDFDVLYPKDGILVHTNHFTSLRLPRAPYHDTLKRSMPNSFHRLGRLDKLVRAVEGPIGVQDLKTAFADHAGAPFAICRHEGDEMGGLSMSTVFAIVMDLTNLTLHICPKHPCNTPFETVLLKDGGQ
ncbi:C45 family autoproteolytic acyltransferase/hydolase [Anaerotruncus rubiinfantis]|uniref:C45 family autoproteolytic acyltransferase/hydolase n=1 Tax=Anaerotruncus rubiinfantis TaxID=1720200 RepID=UPI00189AD062|nr:C45 family peptidase [Anaerotruncus rubiinfantis]